MQVDRLELFTASDEEAFRSWVRATALREAALAGEPIDADCEGIPKRASLSAVTGLMRVAAMLGGKFRFDPASRGAIPVPVAQPSLKGPDPTTSGRLPPVRMLRGEADGP